MESLSASFHITDSEPASVPEPSMQPASTQQILDVGEIYLLYASATSPAEFTKAMQSLTALKPVTTVDLDDPLTRI